jgi:hypothetical protein
VGQQEAPGETEEAKAATGAVDSPWPGRRSPGPPHHHLRRHHGWTIESYYKLLKGAGQRLEHWQQQDARALVRRLLVASMACALVWRLARSTAPEAPAARKLLQQLSGRQLAWGQEFTEEALLAGLWALLAMVEVLQERTPEDLQAIADFVLAGSG